MRRRKSLKRTPSRSSDIHVARRVFQRDGFACQLCGSRRDLHVHHVGFRCQGGDDSASNLVSLCRGCHEQVHLRRVRIGGPAPS